MLQVFLVSDNYDKGLEGKEVISYEELIDEMIEDDSI